ncbi:MAG: autotransporter outer membrane beta-barrel domain-containing protein [Kiritimatiellales bacterium]|nr:autotransporter outer membrane beta-barrel domain-containing protein [Kiritimatiellales bacterium]MCF7863167.1 autotransporter outer membrane beta-barrel domain-containing protein [Kiritimatiellales bacterium]
MNRIYSVFLASATTCAVSFGAITNLVFTGNGTQTTNLVNNQYFGATGRDAAAITNVANVLVSASKFTGGTAATVSTNTSIARNGGSGLALSNIDLVTVSNQLVEAESIRGGKGGDVTVTAVASPITVNGGAGLWFTGIGATDSLAIDGALIVGGDGGRISSSTAVALASANGGSAILANKIRIDANAGTYTGGAGGNINVSSSSVAEALGGHGLELGSLFTLDALTGSAVFNGGSGGIITNGSGRARAFGGDGIHLFADYVPMDLVLDGGSYQGGNGGTAVFNTADVATKYDVSNLDINGARGGNGVRISRVDQFPDGSTLTIDSGEFTGGDGGISRNTGTGSVNANGGSGVFIDFMDVTVNGGTFIGGKAGTVNGTSGVAGAGAHFQDSTVEINDGDFQGNVGLRITSRYYTSTTTINNGKFSNAEFSAIDDGAYPGFSGLNNINIAGGSFGDITFNGTTVNNSLISGAAVGNIYLAGSGKNNLTLTGGTNGTISLAGSATVVNTVVSSGAKVGGLVFDGSGKNTATVSGAGLTNLSFAGTAVNTLSISNNNVAIANVNQYTGTATVNLLTPQVINNMYISNGTMNISGSDLAVSSGNTYRMGATTARLNTSKKLTVQSGGTLDVGLGQVSATAFVANSESQLRTQLNNVTNGLITGTALTFNSGVKWSLYGSSTNTEFKLASASGTLTNRLTATDFDYASSDWWVGVSSVTNRSMNLYATLGDKPWDVALGAEPGSEYEKAMQDLSLSVTNGTPVYNSLTGMGQLDAQRKTREAYVRAPEMANTLIRLQEVFAGQIKDRTSSFRRYENWGSRASGTPSGAQGPESWYADSMEWLGDHLPSWDVRGAMKGVDDAAPRPNLEGDPSNAGKPYMSSSTKSGSGEYATFMDWLNGLLPGAPADKVELPPTYQVWGRGYGSYFDQKGDDQYAGYNASMGGAIAGIDKRFNSLLLGLAGGYAHTQVNGNSGSDGDADTGHGTLYAAFNGDRGYVDANVNYAYNAVTTEGDSTFGYTGKYDASAFSMYLGGGLGYSAFHDTVLFTPEVSLLSTYYNRDGYTETSSLAAPDKQWDSYDQWSYLGSLGATLSMIRKIESFNLEMEFQPELRAHWLHEFNAEMDAPTYMMAGGANTIGVSLQAREEDLIQIGTGVRFSKWNSDTLEFGLDVDGVFGQDYSACTVSGKLLHRF